MKIVGFYSLTQSDEIIEAGTFELIDKEAQEIYLRLTQKYSLCPLGVRMERLSESQFIQCFYFANSYQIIFEYEIKER